MIILISMLKVDTANISQLVKVAVKGKIRSSTTGYGIQATPPVDVREVAICSCLHYKVFISVATQVVQLSLALPFRRFFSR